MTAGAVRKIGFEWALEGKHPGSFDDYELLDHSRRRLDTRIFQEIRSRYVTGISPQLPQVTIARAKTGQDEQVVRYVVLAVQNWSEHRDGTNRRIAHTRWFYVPYEQLIEHPVTYEALYGAFAALPTELDPAAPPTVDVPALDPLTLSPGGDALSTAALLMTGRPVCVVGAERVEMLERLRFLDTVAALLPYGMRANLTATTWISSTAEHRIRLSFARHAPEGTHTVAWGDGAEIPIGAGQAEFYLDTLATSEIPLLDIMGSLSRQTEPLSFAKQDRMVAMELLHRAAHPRYELEPEPEPEPEEPDRSPSYLHGESNRIDLLSSLTAEEPARGKGRWSRWRRDRRGGGLRRSAALGNRREAAPSLPASMREFAYDQDEPEQLTPYRHDWKWWSTLALWVVLVVALAGFAFIVIFNPKWDTFPALDTILLVSDLALLVAAGLALLFKYVRLPSRVPDWTRPRRDQVKRGG